MALILKLFLVGALATGAWGAEEDALAISRGIQERHMPFGTILDPMYAAPDTDEITGYTRCGDSAIWTGHYLAAEAFRYHHTRDDDALHNVWRALWGIRQLMDVTAPRALLARCIIPVESPYAVGILQEEAHHGNYMGSLDGQPYFWVGNTSRDQYLGVFFGLSVAYDLVDDPNVRGVAAHIVTRLLDDLMDRNFAIVMPGGEISTVFWSRADQRLTLLQIGRRMNPGRFDRAYTWAAWAGAGSMLGPISLQLLDPHGSYFKFNLNSISFYNLIRLGGSSAIEAVYRQAYNIMRRTLAGHGNAHFNMIDFEINGPDEARDADTRQLLEDWLQRPRRDEWVDLRDKYPACDENQACQVIPAIERVTTDFLWQRSPFQLYGGGSGTIEGAGIDYILPYWMARHYGVIVENDPEGELTAAPDPGEPRS
ncbi:MAG: hypothetical protein IPM24_18285 [Bryobacterales bacterium]|nr:hypothetical protein [Bryobacterales bacterium]